MPSPTKLPKHQNNTTLASSSRQPANVRLAHEILGPYPVRCGTPSNPRISLRSTTLDDGETPLKSVGTKGTTKAKYGAMEARAKASEAFNGPLGKNPVPVSEM